MSETDLPGRRDRDAEAEARAQATGSGTAAAKAQGRGAAPAAAAAGGSIPAGVPVDVEALRAHIEHFRGAQARVVETAGGDPEKVEVRRGAWDALSRMVAPAEGDGSAAEVGYARAFFELGQLVTGGVVVDVATLAQRVREITDPIFEATDGDDWLRDWPDREWLIPGWLPVGRLGLLSGRGGRGKSRLAVQVAARIAADPKVGTVPIPPMDGMDDPGAIVAVTGAMDGLDVRHCGPALFVSWEDERAEIGRRLSQLGADKLIDVKGIAGQFRYVDARAEGPLWAQSPDGPRYSAELTPCGRKVRATCERMGARLLVVDSLAGAYAGDENARHLVRAFCANWDAWASASRCAVMLVSHPPKTQAGAGARAVDADYSGSTDWHNAARWRWSLAPEPTGAREEPAEGSKRQGESVDAPALRLAKASYGPGNARIFLVGSATQIGWRGCSTEYAIRVKRGESGKTPASDEQGGLGFDPLAT